MLRNDRVGRGLAPANSRNSVFAETLCGNERVPRGGGKPPALSLYSVLKYGTKICVFCTGNHVSMGEITQFCILTKIYVAIGAPFVYNVLIAVPGTHSKSCGRDALPERSF